MFGNSIIWDGDVLFIQNLHTVWIRVLKSSDTQVYSSQIESHWTKLSVNLLLKTNNLQF